MSAKISIKMCDTHSAVSPSLRRDRLDRRLCESRVLQKTAPVYKYDTSSTMWVSDKS
jgi:hypothetical protein